MEKIADNIWILGVETGADIFKISCLDMESNEIISENIELEESWQPEEALEKLISYCNGNERMKNAGGKIILTGAETLWDKMKKMEQLLFQQGYHQDDIRIISKENAFIHYVLGQEEEIRRHTVMLFEFDGMELSCCRMHYAGKKEQKKYKTEKKTVGSFSLSGPQDAVKKRVDEQFSKVAKEILSKEVVSAVYLTGKGFQGDWLDKSLAVVCDGRRAFLGQNLFSTGCCYFGNSLLTGTMSGIVIQAPETVIHDAGILDDNEGGAFVPLISSGCAWYDARGSVDVILERSNKLEVVFVNTLTDEKQVESVDLYGLPERPRKTGRLELTIEFFSSNTGAIFVKDKGFGAFYPATDQVFFKKFTLL